MKNELIFQPVIEKPNPYKMIYLSIRIDGKSKTKIDANIKIDEEGK
tara:strand:- start:1570 stop:1707 length:138 start_codon:yes stop_codon:yes gene_type:complete